MKEKENKPIGTEENKNNNTALISIISGLAIAGAILLCIFLPKSCNKQEDPVNPTPVEIANSIYDNLLSYSKNKLESYSVNVEKIIAYNYKVESDKKISTWYAVKTDSNKIYTLKASTNYYIDKDNEILLKDLSNNDFSHFSNDNPYIIASTILSSSGYPEKANYEKSYVGETISGSPINFFYGLTKSSNQFISLTHQEFNASDYSIISEGLKNTSNNDEPIYQTLLSVIYSK